MKAVLQRVKRAQVLVDGVCVGSCGHGLMILLGVDRNDTKTEAEILALKIANLRIFSDENDKMNLSVKNVEGSALVVSNFTLLADYSKGNRPDYFNSAPPETANALYVYFTEKLRDEIGQVETGVFGAHMEVTIVNDGPVTITMDSDNLKKKTNR